MKKLIYALGLAAFCYLVAEKGYNMGVKETLAKIRKYAEEHPNETFEEFFTKEGT